MSKSETVVLISFYERTSENTRILSNILRKAGHKTYLLFFKDDRAAVIDELKSDNTYYQLISNFKYVGTGEDVNPPTEKEFDILVDKVMSLQPDVVGFSTRSVAKELTKKIALRLKDLLPSARYIAGGFGPSLDPDYFIEFIDYVCLGEGTKAILDLVELDDPTESDNVCSLKDGKLYYNKLANAEHLDTQSIPDWSSENVFIIEDETVSNIRGFYDEKTYNIFTSIGCPATCTYCQAAQIGHIYRKYDTQFPKIRQRSPQNVIEELIWAKEKFDLQNVRFIDSIFGYSKTWFYEFMDLYNKHIKLEFNAFLDERWIDDEMMAIMAKSGLQRSVVGLQSTTEGIRKDIMGRDVKDEKIVKFSELLVKYKVPFKYDLINFNPYETNEILRKGVDFLRKLPKGEQVDIFELKIHPGSVLEDMIARDKPTSLSNQEYEYWGLIYQLILSSDEGEEIADFALQYDSFRGQPQILSSLLTEVSSKNKTPYKLFASRDIEANERITSVMLIRKKTDVADAIRAEKIRGLINKKTRSKISKGSPVTINDIYGSYEDKLPFA